MQPTGSRLILYGDKNASFSLYDIADIHFGNRACAKHVLEADVQRVNKDPYALWVLGGDYGEFISWTDPRFDPECVDSEMTVNDMAELAAYLLKGVSQFLSPISSKCLGACIGNHEQKYFTSKSQTDIHTAMCELIDCQNLRYSGWFDLFFQHMDGMTGCQLIKRPKPEMVRLAGQTRLRVFVHHGFSGAITAGGKMNALKRALDMVDADLVMLGHMHEQIAKSSIRLGVDDLCSTVTHKTSLGMVTGTYLRTYAMNQSGYGEMRGYPPTTLGATRAVFTPATMSLTVENRADGVGTRF